MDRTPAVAGRFYPDDPDRCRDEADRCLAEARAALAPGRAALLGGVVPHAGWVFSGPTAARTVAALAMGPTPSTVCVLGAMHRGCGPRSAAWPSGRWQTPLGPVAIDEALTGAIVDAGAGAVTADPEPHAGEHSIEVQLPLLQRVWPQARLVAVLVPPSSHALTLGAALARALHTRADVLVLASSDLTHYGRLAYGFAPWGEGAAAVAAAKANDRRLLDRVAALDGAAVLRESAENRNACGAGAIAAAVAHAAAAGATGTRLLAHVTSAEVRPEHGREAFVGYAAVVFEKAAARPVGKSDTPTPEERRQP